MLQAGGDPRVIKECSLFMDHGELISLIDEFLSTCGEDLIVDISSLPKRFFFPFLKRTLAGATVKNLLVTYSIPGSYAPGPLAEHFGEWKPLPLFAPVPEPDYRQFVISVGFMSMGLPDQVKQIWEENRMPVDVLFPFPPGPPAFQRNWAFVRDLEQDLAEGLKLLRVDAKDVSCAFDHLLTINEKGTKAAILAPFGPKPHSLAMCLYALQTECKVCYTQPSVYSPDYSLGRAMRNGFPEVYAYCVRIDGRDLYTVNAPARA